MWRRIWIPALSSLALASCYSTGGGCPPLVKYTKDQQRAASAEMRVLPKDAQIAAMIGDYGKMRKACRIAGPP